MTINIFSFFHKFYFFFQILLCNTDHRLKKVQKISDRDKRESVLQYYSKPIK